MKRLKNRTILFTSGLLIISVFYSCFPEQESVNKEQLVLIETSQGNMKIKLYNETPLHRDNFIKLVNGSYYNGLLFHRIINEFMIQAGDPDSRNANPGEALGNGGPGYTVAAEFNPNLFHKKGAIAAARMGDQVNPEKRSSGSQFYLVQGKKFTSSELDHVEQRINDMLKQAVFFGFIKNEREKAIANGEEPDMAAIQQSASLQAAEKFDSMRVYKIPETQREIYMNLGGVPHLDQNYTVFGEVVEGLQLIDKIASSDTDSKNRPKQDIKIISMQLVKK